MKIYKITSIVGKGRNSVKAKYKYNERNHLNR